MSCGPSCPLCYKYNVPYEPHASALKSQVASQTTAVNGSHAPASKFYLVWTSKRGAASPTYRHLSYGQAHTEAVRLSKVNPEETFIVLEAKSQVRTRIPVTYKGETTTIQL